MTILLLLATRIIRDLQRHGFSLFFSHSQFVETPNLLTPSVFQTQKDLDTADIAIVMSITQTFLRIGMCYDA